MAILYHFRDSYILVENRDFFHTPLAFDVSLCNVALAIRFGTNSYVPMVQKV